MNSNVERIRVAALTLRVPLQVHGLLLFIPLALKSTRLQGSQLTTTGI